MTRTVLAGGRAAGAVEVTPDTPTGSRRPPRWLWVAAGLAIAAAVALRFLALSPMWLDEAQTVAIARRGLGSMFDTLRIDGSPPVFYLLLHGWMDLVGTGTVAVRALSGVLSVACLPLAWVAARRLGMSRQAAWIVVLLLATCPFAVRYATEARMYSLVLLLTLLAIIAFERVWRASGVLPILAAALVVAALLLTHYWALFLYAVAAAVAVILAVRGSRPARRCLVALALGAIPFLPWLPTFAFQMRHTGAPWGKPPGIDTSLLSPNEWAGANTSGTLLSVAYYALVLLALVGVWRADGRLSIERPVRRLPAALAGIAAGALVLGVVVGSALGSSYASRYSMIALAPVLLAMAMGVAAVPERWRLRTVALLVLLGLASAATLPAQQRTQAQQVADHLTGASATDVVAFCPDQLGPAVHRLLPDSGRQVLYPTLAPATIVNWVDYKQRVQSSRPEQFVRRLLALAGNGTIYLVYATDYPLFSTKCSRVLLDLSAARGRPQTPVRPLTGLIERDGLAVFAARGSG